MKNILGRFKSIRSRLVVFFLIASILPALIVGSISYYISIKVIEEKASKSSVKTLTHIRDNIEKQLESLVQVSDTIFVDRNIKKVISTNYTDDVDFKVDMKDVNDFFDNFFMYSVVGKYVSSIILIGDNGKEVAIGDDAYTVSRDLLKNSPLYEQAREANGRIVWAGTHENWAEIWREKYTLSMARLIKDEGQTHGVGVAFVSFRESAISDLYRNIELGSSGAIFIIDSEGKVISHSNKEMIEIDLSSQQYIRQVLNDDIGYIITSVNNRKMLSTYCTSSRNGWKIIESVPLNELIRESDIIRNITILVILSCTVMGLAFSWIISERISRPIKKLQKTMKRIEAGDWDVRADESNLNEIGQLSHSFNYMMGKIKELLQKVVDEQVEKKEAEYQALLSQVNPHFLYNTLNSIKWMAIIQKSESIKDMVSALGRLLQKSIKNVDGLVTLEEEISMAHDYIHIQQFRYKDKFRIEFSIEQSMLDYMTPKFVLQPIIENAIFHGLEPKEGLGVIKIDAALSGESLILGVQDDGVGMTGEQIKEVLEMGNSNTRGFSAIGVKNVDERIKRIFGQQYGIGITSSVGEFTRVEVRVPAIRSEEEEHKYA